MKLENVAANYDRLAEWYDRGIQLVFEPMFNLSRLRQQTVCALGDLRGARVLDIGCGTGLNLPLLVKQVGSSGEVVALDYSEGMLAQAANRVRRAGWENVTLVQGDAATLDTVEGAFDAVISTWALGIVHDLPLALQSAMRVLKPGGRLAILDFDRTVPDAGLHRLLTPIYHKLLLSFGIDAPEDLDNERLQKRWAEGRAFLRQHLADVSNTPYFDGGGFLFSGRKPRDGDELAEGGRANG